VRWWWAGCERNQINGLLKEQGLTVGSRLRTFVMQEEGGTTRTIAAGMRIERMLRKPTVSRAPACRRAI